MRQSWCSFRLLFLGAVTVLLLTPASPAGASGGPCGLAADPFCDGECPPGDACVDLGGFCECVPSGGRLCGELAGPPLCWGECPPGTPICVDGGAFCHCIVPTLSEWGILGMSVVMLGGVLYRRHRRTRA